ncbi:63c79753-7693-41b3-8d64-b63d58aeb4db [Thermothielavioides terrestris]|nr:63c79753-7693-41b3-8d64-b63d58aeb4db [Thermothielavioides terrestris]
MTYNCI